MNPNRIIAIGSVIQRVGYVALLIGLGGIAVTHLDSFHLPRLPVASPKTSSGAPERNGRTPKTSTSVMPEPPLGAARRTISGIVERIYKELDEGNPSSLEADLVPSAQHDFQMFDAICKPYTYRAHYIENMVERPNGTVEVWVRVLFKPLDEHAYSLLFVRGRDGRFALSGVRNSPENRFYEDKARAVELVHRFISAAQAGRADVLSGLVSADMATDRFVTDPCWQLQLQKFGYELPRVDEITLTSYKGLKVRVDVGGPGTFFVERVNGEYKIVGALVLLKWTYAASGKTCPNPDIQGVEDPNMETRTLRRFHVSDSGAKDD